MFHQRVTSTGFELVRSPDIETGSSNGMHPLEGHPSIASASSSATVTPVTSGAPSPWILGTVSSVQGQGLSAATRSIVPVPGDESATRTLVQPASVIGDLVPAQLTQTSSSSFKRQGEVTPGSSTISNVDSASTPTSVNAAATTSVNVSDRLTSLARPSSPLFPSSSSYQRPIQTNRSLQHAKWDMNPSLDDNNIPFSWQWESHTLQRLAMSSMDLSDRLMSLIDEERWVEQRIAHIQSMQHDLLCQVLETLRRPSSRSLSDLIAE